VCSIAAGVVTLEQFMDHQKRLRSDAEFDPSFGQLADFLPTAELKLTNYEVERVASDKLFAETSRRAIVAGSAVIFGLCRMFEAYRETSGAGERVKVFYDRDLALKWLFSRSNQPITQSKRELHSDALRQRPEGVAFYSVS